MRRILLAFFGCLAAGSVTGQETPSLTLDLSVVASPAPAVPGQPVTYTATIHNAGPGDALNVVLYQSPELNLTFHSADASQGTCDRPIGGVRCRLGTIPAGQSASMVTVYSKLRPGTVNHRFSGETTSPGSIRPVDVEMVVQGDFAFDEIRFVREPMSYTFSIARLAGASEPATLRLTTTGLTATPGLDFVVLDQPLQFAAGETVKSVTFSTLDDSEVEPNEELDFRLTNAAGALVAMQRIFISDEGDQPHITSVTPAAVAPGARVTIRGDNFRPEFRYVFIGAMDVTPVSVTPTEVVLIVPRLSPGQVFLAIFPPGVGSGPGRPLTILPAEPVRRRSSRS